jgi:BirA family biotin operon repressor/biotin-[acetyl-CoA-carboxylase] ligase
LPDYSANRSVLVSRLLCSLGHGLEKFMKQRLEPFRQEWMHKHAYSNKRILTDGMNPREGTAIGIDGNGALLLKLDSGEIIPVQAGEISILGE